MTVDTTTGEIVPADHMATIEQMDPATQEVAVTKMLGEARSWLAHAKEATDPKVIATFKAQMATVAEATKQLNLSKDIQLDAQEMVRRGERGVGLAVRNGQAAGAIETPQDARSRAGRTARGTYQDGDTDLIKVNDLATTDELRGTGSTTGIYQMTDDVSDEEFDAAIEDAKAEENLSRANVVRKVKGQQNGHKTRKQKADAIAPLAEEGYSSRQIAKKLGYAGEKSDTVVRDIAREYGIEIPADKAILRTRRNIDHHRIVANTVSGLEGTRVSLDMLDVTQLEDLSEVDYWVDSLTESAKALRKLCRQLSALATTGRNQS